ncbi:hypothetical protein [Sphingomonas sp.]|uniref:hypothetical protein n=1 Tax=Sphingomonas sp. TaxID=28214 RepID=UPI0025D38E84|nr:hypothetical protein [Sphingomonas sp.]
MRLKPLSLLALSLGCGAPLSASTMPHGHRTSAAAIVDRLGSSASKFSDYEALDANRCTALPLLISALEKLPPVRPGKVGGALGRPDNPLTDRTSDLLRALRILTNHDEFGPITRREFLALPVYPERPGVLDGILQRDSLIADLPDGRSRYFSYWISHGSSFYAPQRTQRAIKAQWRTFVTKFDCHARLPRSRWHASFFNG